MGRRYHPYGNQPLTRTATVRLEEALADLPEASYLVQTSRARQDHHRQTNQWDGSTEDGSDAGDGSDEDTSLPGIPGSDGPFYELSSDFELPETVDVLAEISSRSRLVTNENVV